jgi:hypothetical protein
MEDGMTGRLCRRLTRLLFIVGSVAQHGPAQQPVLGDGVISYTTRDGQRKLIDVGKKCADLWVAPDESVIAFIAIESDLGPDPAAPELPPYITESSIYIARKSAGFAPELINVGTIRASGTEQKAFRNPQVAPGEGSVLFAVQLTINASEVFAHDLKTGQNTDIGAAGAFCVEWDGRHSGSVLTQRSYVSFDSVDGSAAIKHHCYLWSGPGDETVLGECEYFRELAAAWSHSDGGSCH